MKEQKEAEILSLLQHEASYEKGFRMLMEEYQERLYWHVRRMVIEHEDANDVLQNTFVKVFRNLKSFQGKSKLYTWLYRIASNESITFLKSKKRKASASLDGEILNTMSNQLKADHYFDGDEAQRRLQEAISQLPDKQKLVFNMRYYNELSYKEISEILETSTGALKASYHHAVKKIEHFLRGAQTN